MRPALTRRLLGRCAASPAGVERCGRAVAARLSLRPSHRRPRLPISAPCWPLSTPTPAGYSRADWHSQAEAAVPAGGQPAVHRRGRPEMRPGGAPLAPLWRPCGSRCCSASARVRLRVMHPVPATTRSMLRRKRFATPLLAAPHWWPKPLCVASRQLAATSGSRHPLTFIPPPAHCCQQNVQRSRPASTLSLPCFLHPCSPAR